MQKQTYGLLTAHVSPRWADKSAQTVMMREVTHRDANKNIWKPKQPGPASTRSWLKDLLLMEKSEYDGIKLNVKNKQNQINYFVNYHAVIHIFTLTCGLLVVISAKCDSVRILLFYLKLITTTD